MTSTLSDLIERLERASGPDRELDCTIIKASFGVNPYPISSELRADWKWYSENHPISTVPPYTASIDAALTLFRPGYGAISLSVGESGQSSAQLGHPYVYGNAKTPALALCIAALKARAQVTE